MSKDDILKASKTSGRGLENPLSNEPLQCPLDYAFGRIGGKYKGRVIFNLRKGRLRYGELKRRINGVMPKMLTQVLRDLERDGLITRMKFKEVPLRVEYELTPDAIRLVPFLNLISGWGRELMLINGIPAYAKEEDDNSKSAYRII